MRKSSKKRAEQSLLQATLRSHYFELIATWNEAAVNELCNKLNWPKHDLAAAVGLLNFQMDNAIKRNRFSVPVCMHFKSLDDYATVMRGGIAPPSPVDEFIK